jgi:hypothetical protein
MYFFFIKKMYVNITYSKNTFQHNKLSSRLEKKKKKKKKKKNFAQIRIVFAYMKIALFRPRA